jgi:Right handed beta helix region
VTAKLVIGALTIGVMVAGLTSCTSAGQAVSAGSPSSSSPPSYRGVTRDVTVTCRDSVSDAARLQKTIDGTTPGAEIDIQGGTCLLTKGITLLGDRTYAGGNTSGTVLKQDAAMPYLLASSAYVQDAKTTGSPLQIRNLTIACNGSGRTDGIIVLDWDSYVEGVNVAGCGGSGIVDTNSNADGRAISNTSVNSRFDNNFITNSGQNGFEVLDGGNSVTDGYLDDNQIASSGRDAISLANSEGWNISGNHLYQVGQNAIQANRMYGTTIADNYIEDFGDQQTSGTWYGIVGTEQGSVGSTIDDNKITNDSTRPDGASYIYLGITQANYGTGYLSVTGNVIVGTRPGDIGVYFSGGGSRLVVTSSGNLISGRAVRKYGSGVSVSSGY